MSANATQLRIPTNASSISALARSLRETIGQALEATGVAILPPMDVADTLRLMQALEFSFDSTILDPWYNKGIGGVREDYLQTQLALINSSGAISQHVFFWGFPEIVAPFVERISKPLALVCWLTWYYKNNPSVIRGWRSSQNACLHLSHEGAKLYPERFLNQKQLDLKARGKLRYMPGPTSVLEGVDDVIEQPLLVGFVGRSEQTGHPSQKPVKVYDQLLQMTVAEGGALLDPMCGSGTAGAVAMNRGFKAVLCDGSEEYTCMVEKRLAVRRLPIQSQIKDYLEMLPK